MDKTTTADDVKISTKGLQPNSCWPGWATEEIFQQPTRPADDMLY